MRRLALALALVAASAARAETQAPPAAGAEEKPLQAWEVDLFAGYGQLAWPTQDTTNLGWSNGGPGFALTFAYRGPHFTHPFFELAYIPILGSGRYVNVFTPSGTQTQFASNSTWAWGLVVGPGWDVDWFRFRAGVGLYDVVVHTNVAGVTNTVAQVTVGFQAAASALVWRPDPFAVGVEVRIVGLQMPLTGIYQSMWEVGLTGRWDFTRFR